MLTLNLNRMFFLRGITNPHRFLVSNGFSSHVSQSILNNEHSHIKMQYLLRLCEILRCTPDDLFDYKPSKNTYIDEAHPLHSLKKEPIPVNIPEYFLKASFADIEQLQNIIIQQQKKSG